MQIDAPEVLLERTSLQQITFFIRMQATANCHHALLRIDYCLHHITESLASHVEKDLPRDRLVNQDYLHCFINRQSDSRHFLQKCVRLRHSGHALMTRGWPKVACYRFPPSPAAGLNITLTTPEKPNRQNPE